MRISTRQRTLLPLPLGKAVIYNILHGDVGHRNIELSVASFPATTASSGCSYFINFSNNAPCRFSANCHDECGWLQSAVITQSFTAAKVFAQHYAG